jgi:hypothetical protein
MRLVIKLLSCILLFTLGNNVHAQNENKKNVFSGHIGVSLPTNEFAAKTFDYDAGFATAGGNAELNYYRYTGKFFALNASIGYSVFGFNESAYTNEYYLALNRTEGITTEAGAYQFLNTSFGLVFKIPIGSDFEVLFVPMIGVALCHHPDLIVTDDVTGVINSVSKDNSAAASAGIKAQVNYYFSEKYGINLSYSRFSTTPTFSDETSFEQHFTLPVSFQNINIGFTIML